MTGMDTAYSCAARNAQMRSKFYKSRGGTVIELNHKTVFIGVDALVAGRLSTDDDGFPLH